MQRSIRNAPLAGPAQPGSGASKGETTSQARSDSGAAQAGVAPHLTAPRSMVRNHTASRSLHLLPRRDGLSPPGLPREFGILVIDDQLSGRLLMTEILRGVAPRADIVALGDPFQAIDHVARNPVDLVLTDYRMPAMDGAETIRRLREFEHMQDVPIVCVTIVDNRDVRHRALDAGATDFLTRPLDAIECATRCRNLLELRRHQLASLDYAGHLERHVEAVTKELEERKMETLYRLAKVAEQRDSDTGLHLIRMAKYSALLGRRCGWNEAEQRAIELAAPLHDIGKIGIPDMILQAPRRLSEDELVIMRTHAQIGFDMLHGSGSNLLQMAATIAHAHHEKFDGSGYPRGLVGEETPIEARIVAIADVFDALTSNRPYKKAWASADAVAHMRAEAGRHFDPRLLELFLSDPAELDVIRLGHSDPDPDTNR